MESDSDSRPRQPKGIRRKRLQCPFTWSIPVMSDEVLIHEQDSVLLASDTWNLVLNKLFLAYQYVMRDDVKRGKRLVSECYMPLLTVKDLLACDSDVIEEYRTAIKHIIDSTWAFICCKTTPVKDMEVFLQSITPYSCMTDHQKSAVMGINGRFAQHEDGLRSIESAISLNPNEGLWLLYKALLLHQFRLGSRVASLEKLKLLRSSYQKRITPESTIVYAVALTSMSQQLHRSSDFKKGLELLRDSLTKWPSNPYVNFKSGVVFHKFVTEHDNLYVAERCLRNAIRLIAPAKSKIACKELGVFLVTYKDPAEGKMYLQMAKEVNYD